MLWILLVISAAGLALTAYLRVKKSKKQSIPCLLKEKCSKVLGSKYAVFLGIPNETLGMSYYILMIVGILFLLFDPAVIRADGAMVLLFATAIAFAFSMHQTAVQAFVLKAWCSWCILSAILNTAILSLLPWAIPYPLIDTLAQSRDFFMVFHVIAAVLGIATATVSDITFLRFLKDFRVSVQEAKILEQLSQVAWSSVALFIVSGVALFLPQIETYVSTPKFLVKMVVVAVIIVNGTLLNLLVAPKLTAIPFNRQGENGPKNPELDKVRRLAFTLGPISLVSWYSALALGLLKDMPFSFWELLSIYIGLLLIGMSVGKCIEQIIYVGQNRLARRPRGHTESLPDGSRKP